MILRIDDVIASTTPREPDMGGMEGMGGMGGMPGGMPPMM